MKKFLKYSVLVCLVGIVTSTSGCTSWSKGGSHKKAWITSDGGAHEEHSKWEFSDPLTATKNFLGSVVEVNGSINYYGAPGVVGGIPGPNGYGNGKFFDHSYNRWCDNGNHLVTFDGQVYEVLVGSTVVRGLNGKVVIEPKK